MKKIGNGIGIGYGNGNGVGNGNGNGNANGNGVGSGMRTIDSVIGSAVSHDRGPITRSVQFARSSACRILTTGSPARYIRFASSTGQSDRVPGN